MSDGIELFKRSVIKKDYENEEDYEKLYLDLKKRFDDFVKHRCHNVKRCKYCKEWYKEVIEKTNKIKNKQVRENLIEVWETLWLNNCLDFDVIANIFEVKKQ